MITASSVVHRSALAFALLLGAGAAEAQLTTAEQQCVDGYNNKLRLVSQQKGRDDRSCIKRAGKWQLPSPDACVDTVGPRTASKVLKVNDLFVPGGKCTGSEPIQQGAAAGATAHTNGVTALTHDLFGAPLSGVVNPGNDVAKCQDTTLKRAAQLFTEKVKGFRKCKKDGMREGAITDSATLEAACLTPSIPEPALKIAGKVQKLLADVNDACNGLTLATVFAGLDASCAATTAAAGACIEQRVECRVCETLNAADGTDRNCDLFDDGVLNFSCVGNDAHTCVLDQTGCLPFVTPSCVSRIFLHITALPVPLTFRISGALDLALHGDTAACQIQSIAPINVPCIGFLCVTPGTPCPLGSRHCGPGAGPPLGVNVQSDGMAGSCTSNAQCQTICGAACGAAQVQAAGCTGFCSAGAGAPCTSDAQCAGLGQNACNGFDPVVPAQANICQCTCVDAAAYGPSNPGDFQCNLPANLAIEFNSPCDGTDVSIGIGSTCVPFSTQRASALITNANFVPGSTVPAPPNVNDQSGTPLDCATIGTSTTTGLRVGATSNFFGSGLGDMSVGVSLQCQ